MLGNRTSHLTAVDTDTIGARQMAFFPARGLPVATSAPEAQEGTGPRHPGAAKALSLDQSTFHEEPQAAVGADFVPQNASGRDLLKSGLPTANFCRSWRA